MTSLTKKFSHKCCNYKSLKAFSFIEVAVIFLIVAVTLIGVMQGREMYYKMRLNTARVITESSQVQSIDTLALWLETTLEESLYLSSTDTSAPNILNNDQKIGRWNDLNFDKNLQVNLFQDVDDNRPKYQTNGINGLPALLFDGVNDFMQNTKKYFVDNFVLYIVGKPLRNCVNPSSGHFGTSGQNYLIYPQFESVSAGAGVSVCLNQIATVEHSSSYMPSRNLHTAKINNPVLIRVVYSNRTPSLYVNSKFINTASLGTKEIVPGFSVGRDFMNRSEANNYGYFSGLVGEIIYFSSVIKDDDIRLVEDYLMEKWQIK